MPWEKSKVRTIGRNKERKLTEMPDELAAYLAAVVAVMARRRIGLMIGTLTTTGGVKVTFYLPDDKCQAYINAGDNLARDVPDIIAEVLDEKFTYKDLVRNAPWLAETPQEASELGERTPGVGLTSRKP